MPFTGNVGMVTDFHGWPDAFYRFKLLSQAFLNVARQRGDVYAAAFLKDIEEVSERAWRRATEAKSS